MEVTFEIPDGVSVADAQAIIGAFEAARKAAEAAAEQPQQVAEAPEQEAEQEYVAPYTAPQEDDAPDPAPSDGEHDPDRSFSSVPNTGTDIPTVSMVVVAQEGGIYGDVSVLRMNEQANELQTTFDEYRVAADAAAQDPDRKRPPRIDPGLVDLAVQIVVRKKHSATRDYVYKTRTEAGHADAEARNLADSEQMYIGFTIENVRKYTPMHDAGNYGTTGWGIVELIQSEFGVTLTRAQVRASVARLYESGFLHENGKCGKSTRYRLSDFTEFLYTKPSNDDDNA